MSSPRWLASLTIPIIASAAVVSSAAVASATPTDDAYLNQLRASGLTWPAGDDDALIGMAYLICNDLDLNWTPQHIASSIHANLDQDNIHVNDVGTMVNAAHSIYCPGAGYNAGAAGGGGGGGGG
jgi:thiamine pyrophosphate-dependent acetolactate synthase large subunit-like protein